MTTMFDVEPEQFKRLGSGRAVAFFADLLWAEARRLGVPSTRLRIPTNINVKDGGIDATVDRGADFGPSDLVCEGKTGFQIKTGAFQPNDKSTLQRELFGKTPKGYARQAKPQFLKPGIKECLDVQGRYIVVAFGAKMAAPQKKKAIHLLLDFFAKCGFQSPSVDVWGQDDLKGLVQPFPSLCLRINQHDGPHVR